MKRHTRFVPWLALVVTVVGAAFIPSALAQATFSSPEVRTGPLFVEFEGAPVAEGGNAATAAQQRAAFYAAAKAAGITVKERFAFASLWNGVSVQTNADVASLRRLPGVKAVYPVLTATIPPERRGIDPELETALAMTGADIVQSVLGFDGSGIRVAVMDTGIDLDHPDLGGDGTNGAPYTNPRVVAQWDFVGDGFNADPSSASYQPVASPDPIADDCNGHGTHVAGIIGADGTVTGVAPGVSFGAYRVFGCQGSTTSDIMVAAMERAYRDRMHVLNMSIGSAFNNWPEYPTAKAADLLVQAGMVVVASIGNSGADGVFSAGAPGVGKNVIGVASFDNTQVNLSLATVTPAGLNIGYANATGAPPAPLSGSLPLAKPSGAITGCVAGDFAGVPTGTIILIQRGTCTFYAKALNAQNAGAAGVVLYNNTAGRFSPTVAGSPAITIPVVATSDAQGADILTAINSGSQTWNWTSSSYTEPNLTGGTISSFSSFGLAADLSLKPDIGAPGGLIRSTYPIEAGSYATISGTSMASPHVAGAVALLLEARPGLGAKTVREVLQNSADPKVRFGQAYLDPVHRQGAGLLDIDDAILATTTVRPGKVSLGEGAGGSFVLELSNSSNAPVTYTVGHEPAAATTNTFPAVSYSTAYAGATFSPSTVTVPAGGKAQVRVWIAANPALPDKAVYGGYVAFYPTGKGQEYRVPYAGLKGDYQSIQVMGTAGVGFPFLGQLVGCSIVRGLDCTSGGSYGAWTGPGAVFSMTSAFTVPQFLVHFDHQAQSLAGHLYRASDSRLVGEAFRDDYLPRNSTATSFFAFPWDGTVKRSSAGPSYVVPDGTYFIRLLATKPLSSTTETWTSPTFSIDRP